MKWNFKKPEPGTLAARLWRYRAVLALAGVGLALLLIPSKSEQKSDAVQTTEVAAGSSQDALERRIERALTQIEGAGEVQLVLSWRDGGQTVYQLDERTSASGDSRTSERTTASVPVGSSAQQALVAQQIAPACAGALVVCSGGGSPTVRLSITNALSSLTGLGADQITVVKMKSS